MKQCETCSYWVRNEKHLTWGICTHPKCAKGYTQVYSSWCRKGRICKHSNARHKNTKACKNRYAERSDGMAWIVTYKADNGKMVPLRFSEEAEAREKRQELIEEGFDCGVGIDHVPNREVEE